MRRLVLVALTSVAAGCFDFSQFDHLPDAGVPDGLVLHDMALGGVILDEPFDEMTLALLTGTTWDIGGSSPSAFALDDTVFHGGRSALHIKGGGDLVWTGTLATQPISFHARFYYRLAGVPTGPLNMLNVQTPAANGEGLSVATTGASLFPVLNDYHRTFYTKASVTMETDTWYCFELGVELTGSSAWSAKLWLNGSTMPIASVPQTGFTAPLEQLLIGFGLGGSQTGTTDVWVDSLLVVEGTALIGCDDS